MAADPSLVHSFCAELPGGKEVESPDRMERALADVLAEARDQWPDLTVPPADYVAHLARRVPAQWSAWEALAQLHTVDLYLACACSLGDARAIDGFEQRHFSTVDIVGRRLKLQQVAVEELKQILREQLFVAAPPKGALLIDNYSGRGQLGRWLRVIAVRTAGKLLDQGKKEVPLSDSVLSGLSPPVEDPELEFLKRTYRKEFSQAFEQAACELSVRQRNLLGHHYLDRLSIDEIGSIYAVHRATAARWLVKARETLLAGTRKDLMRRIQVDRAEYESIMRLIESQLPMAFQGTTSDDNPFQK